MATEIFSTSHVAGKTVYFRIFDPSQGAGVNLYTWDFDDDQWETTLAGAADPKLEATEKTDAGGADRSVYMASYDVSNINSTTTPKKVLIQAVDDLAADKLIGETEVTIVSGQIVESANPTMLVGGAQSATDLKDFADTGYDPSTHRTQASLVAILGTTLTETAGLLAGGFKKLFNVASPTGTLNSLPDIVPGLQNGLPILDANGRLQTNQGNVRSASIDLRKYAIPVLHLEAGDQALKHGEVVTVATDRGSGECALAVAGTLTFDDGRGQPNGLPAIVFRSDSDKISTSDAALNTGEFTIFWVGRLNDMSYASKHWFFNRRNDTNANTIGLRVDNGTGGVKVVIRREGSEVSPDEVLGNNIYDSSPHVVAVRYDGTDLTVAVDGVILNTTAASGAIDTDNFNELTIGNHPTAPADSEIALQHFSVFGTALSAALTLEIQNALIAEYLDSSPVRLAPAALIVPGDIPAIDGIGTVTDVRSPCLVTAKGAYHWFICVEDATTYRGVLHGEAPINRPDQITWDTALLAAGVVAGCCAYYDEDGWIVTYDDRTQGDVIVRTGTDLDSLSGEEIVLTGSPGAYYRFPWLIALGEKLLLYIDVRTNGVSGEEGYVAAWSGARASRCSAASLSSEGTVIAAGTHLWMEDDIGSPRATYIGGQVYMTAVGFRSENENHSGLFNHSIGLWVSGDGLSFKEFGGNPILEWSQDDTHWCYETATQAQITFMDGLPVLLYCGKSDAGVVSIGVSPLQLDPAGRFTDRLFYGVTDTVAPVQAAIQDNNLDDVAIDLADGGRLDVIFDALPTAIVPASPTANTMHHYLQVIDAMLGGVTNTDTANQVGFKNRSGVEVITITYGSGQAARTARSFS